MSQEIAIGIACFVWVLVVIRALRASVTLATLALTLIVAGLVFAQMAVLVGIPYGGSLSLTFAGVLLLLFWDKARII